MTGFHCRAEIRLLGVSLSLQDIQVSRGFYTSSFLLNIHLEDFPGTVALAKAERGEAEPVGKDSWGESSIETVLREMVWGLVAGRLTSAFIVWVKGQQAVQSVLLFTPAATQCDDPLRVSRMD